MYETLTTFEFVAAQVQSYFPSHSYHIPLYYFFLTCACSIGYKILISMSLVRYLSSWFQCRIRLFVIVVSMSNCHPRCPGFDSQLYPRNFSGSIGSGTGSTQPREDNWVTNSLRSSEIRFRKLKLKLRDDSLLTTRPPAMQSGSNCFSRSSFF